MATPWAYVDTSVLLKRYFEEEGAVDARRILRRYRVVSSAVAPVEATSALCRRCAARTLTETDLRAILKDLAEDRAYWELIDLGIDVLDRAETVVRRTGVRTLDALHLASALTVQAAGAHPSVPPFITADVRQGGAAMQLGLRVIWVGSPGSSEQLRR